MAPSQGGGGISEWAWFFSEAPEMEKLVAKQCNPGGLIVKFEQKYIHFLREIKFLSHDRMYRLPPVPVDEIPPRPPPICVDEYFNGDFKDYL